ncbi:insulinase family protein [Tissierella pigra]|uniref:Insulinase family protein n=1 Tax=Tissierella pigra TaxID=2607614 RepID=A0A6N7XLB7_9FIRM|nr:insulinase family protein [Tissierella pigra]MBU5425222.1 insulinase family protein [Tissierella pigra]MSU02829.1 insulinase family protein [Tissierella pigra]
MKKFSVKQKQISVLLLAVLLSTFLFSSISPNISYAETKDLKVGETYFGFKLIEEKKLKDLDGIGRIFQHNKTGAKLLQIENDDENKAFSISFRTPVENNKGIPHILEHVLLNGGSEKYPVRNLFFEIVKGTLTKNLNGLTYPDRTTYPFSSMNDKEFNDLMDVYLSVVFKPAFYKDENFFKVDGWHYSIEDKDSPLQYNGVVYNEMKGSLSSPDAQLYYSIIQSLYPNTNYAYISGGNPPDIPSLTFQEVKDFYDKYYHPSNSYIYLYGKIDILEKLQFINDNYLKDFNKKEIDSMPKLQKPFNNKKEVTVQYPISVDDSIEGKSSVALSFAVKGDSRIDTMTSFNVLTYMLFNNQASPVVQELNKAGFYNINAQISSNFLQPFVTITAQNINSDMKDNFAKVLFSSLEDIVEKGIDKDLIKSTLNVVELDLKQQYSRDINTGLMYSDLAMFSWLYDENPFESINMADSFRKLKVALDKPYFEELIKKHILNNNHGSSVLLQPKKGLMEEKEAAATEKLKAYKDSLSDKEIENIIKEYKKLQEWNNTPNSKEVLDTMPVLSLKDLKPNIEETPTNISKIDNITTLHHPLFTNGIGSVNLYFDTSSVKQEQIPYINLLSEVLGKMSTEKYHYSQLPVQETMYTGGINYIPSTFTKSGSNTEYSPNLRILSIATGENLGSMLELISEEISKTKFNDKERLKQLISMSKFNVENQLNNMPTNMAAIRNISYFSPIFKYNDNLNGFGYYDFISDLDLNYDSKFEDIVKNLEEVTNTIFNKNNLVVSITGENAEYKAFKDNLNTLVKVLETKNLTSQEYKFDIKDTNEAFVAPADVLYNFAAFDFTKYGTKYNGSMKVLNNVISDYLFNEIRVKGGAYGASFGIIDGSNILFMSYRDPKLKETYNAYNGTVDFLKNFDLNEKEFEKFIISSLAEYYVPVSNLSKGNTADYYYFTGVKAEDLNKELTEILNTKPEDMKKFAEIIEKGLKENNIVTVGNEKIIKDNKDFFNSIKNLIK